jgi:hypothetical protein
MLRLAFINNEINHYLGKKEIKIGKFVSLKRAIKNDKIFMQND